GAAHAIAERLCRKRAGRFDRAGTYRLAAENVRPAMIVNKSLYPISQNLRSISQMNKQFEALQLQLATGKRYNTLAEMGGDRVHELSLRARLGRIEGFQANVLTVENRLSFYT